MNADLIIDMVKDTDLAESIARFFDDCEGAYMNTGDQLITDLSLIAAELYIKINKAKAERK